ncbi:acyl-CoA dehydrogenase family protein [Streptantibioticus cattleyicolor]|uniref:Acyl-CoA dehydrogenase domain protein n=1 Tax=Streptantibioticus cattleyicolor (strain ATCC 35852 / DSM 46488 / JCM 4925 / NBRC 14057 / NRRL 8057) TaxID=1003195 RepID=F8JL85_STREN|nr:acyl-CoA dehydrogenase family protein [Streptantibioticus cattleyicolor]AEW99629.1 acyl-CoA dehydrogenase domain protein [Streptantibioticus cattleyicolor NRRL 8057 = DSM 46488]CCB71334.1 Acyl-CoA dehydrogenase [Streptantibioticus cattleyicolor NRRL 8057 = DSM 46488]
MSSLTTDHDPAAGVPAAIRSFVDDEIVPYAGEWDRAERIPRDVLDRICELGLWAPFLPEAHGGAALPWTEVGRLHEEVGRGCSAVRSLLTVHTMVAGTVLRWGTDEQRARWLPLLARGEPLGAFCLSEPDSGSAADAAGTVAVPDGTGWRLTGTKTWITGGQVAGVLLVFARVQDAMSAFLVPADAPGVTVTPLGGMMGTPGSMLARIDLDRVPVDAQALIGPEGWAAGTVMTGALDLGRFSVASGSVGVVRACLDACVAYTARRRVRGAKLSELPLIRRKISDMVVAGRAGRLLCAEAGRLKDDDDPATIMASWIAKYYTSTAATAASADAVQIHGAHGFSPDYPVARYYRDARVAEVIEGSTELQQLTIADVAYQEARA